jgi:hypothetical protein
MPPLMVGAANPGKAFMKVSTLEIFLHHFVHHRAKMAALPLTMFIIAGLEIRIVVVCRTFHKGESVGSLG